MPNVRMRVLPSMPAGVRKRLTYRTRMLMADDDEFEVGPSDARILTKAKWAEAAPAPAPRRGRPPKAAQSEPKLGPGSEPEIELEPASETEHESSQEPGDLESMTVGELRELAEKRGIELPPGYIKHDELVEIIEAEDET
jgi:hypothetical protein